MPLKRLLDRVFPAALCALLLSACAGRYGGPHYYGNRWDGRRGYDGSGDYGYDLNASRAEASSYRARASRSYPVPGSADDPWGPYVQQAAARFGVPERWVREVMRQESGGRLQASDGRLTTSPVGAMGLMQVMPATYDMLRRRYGLGSDPYEPRDNILAGTAYIKEMYDRFGAPAFLAAYNAGPDRTDAYLAGATELPDETRNYLARIAPRLGTDVAMTGPLASYAGRAYASAGYGRNGAVRGAPPAYRTAAVAADQAYAGGGMTAAAYYGGSSSEDTPASNDPSDRAYDGGGLITDAAPLGSYAGIPASYAGTPATGAGTPAVQDADAISRRNRVVSRSALVATAATAASPGFQPQPLAPTRSARPDYPQPYGPLPPSYPSAAWADPMAESRPASQSAIARAASMLVPVAAAASIPGAWGVQVGAFPDPALSRAVVDAARSRAGSLLAQAQPSVTPFQRNGTLYRARLTGLTANAATAACTALVRDGMPCLTVPPGS